MGTFGCRRDGVAGCRSFESEVAGASAGAPTKNSEIDFSDVFGGPPRRYSIHRRLYASSEAAAESSSSIESRGSPQPNDEKPVFGDEDLRRSSSRRRRLPSEDFFDDIFRGDEPAPDSRVMSRTHPWLHGAEPSCSPPVPAQSSLSAKLLRGTEVPQFSSGFHPGSSEVIVNGCQFHFSIYKWASKGIPLDMQPGASGWLRLKETEKTETWPSSNGWVEGHHGINKLSAESHQVEIESPGTGDVNVMEQSRSIEEAFLSTLESENIKGAFGHDEQTLKVRRKENTSCTAPKSMAGIENEASVNSLEGVKSISNCEADDFSMQGSSTTSEEHAGVSRLKGNVRKFVEIFNQEASSSPKVHINPQSQSSGCKNREMDPGAKKQTSCGTKRMDEEKRSQAMNGKKVIPDPSVMMDEKFKQEEKPCPNVKSDLHELSDTNIQKNGSASVSDGLESMFNMEESLQENLVLSDARIQKWLSGKEGNIRSLLSTLQFVLWANSGWKPVPLVDIIEAAAVKRAYQKALLCVHPDKLQQKGAAAQRKYLAARVFDILQEAWGQFNSMSTMPA